MKREKMTEAELAEVTRCYFKRKGWDMYPEVVFQGIGGRVDWIGRKRKLCMAVEVKLNLNFTVLEQLTKWCSEMWHRHHVFDGSREDMGIPNVLIAVVQSWGNHSFLKDKIIEQFGLGVIEVDKRLCWRSEDFDKPKWDKRGVMHWKGYQYSFYERATPKIQPGSRKTAYRLLDQLVDDMRVATSGVKTGETDIVTPFRVTMNRIYKVMEFGKEYHIEHLLSAVGRYGGHHYVSDKNAANGIAAGLRREDKTEAARDYGPWFKLKDDKETKAWHTKLKKNT